MSDERVASTSRRYSKAQKEQAVRLVRQDGDQCRRSVAFPDKHR
jgi:transposase-like protein